MSQGDIVDNDRVEELRKQRHLGPGVVYSSYGWRMPLSRFGEATIRAAVARIGRHPEKWLTYEVYCRPRAEMSILAAKIWGALHDCQALAMDRLKKWLPNWLIHDRRAKEKNERVVFVSVKTASLTDRMRRFLKSSIHRAKTPGQIKTRPFHLVVSFRAGERQMMRFLKEIEAKLFEGLVMWNINGELSASRHTTSTFILQ